MRLVPRQHPIDPILWPYLHLQVIAPSLTKSSLSTKTFKKIDCALIGAGSFGMDMSKPPRIFS